MKIWTKKNIKSGADFTVLGSLKYNLSVCYIIIDSKIKTKISSVLMRNMDTRAVTMII